MIKLNPKDGDTKVSIPIGSDFVELFRESEEAAKKMGYTHDLRCFCNYMIAHYDGFFNVNGTKYHVSYPLNRK
jgi:hypothetical protein